MQKLPEYLAKSPVPKESFWLLGASKIDTCYGVVNRIWSEQTDSVGTPYMWHIDMGLMYLKAESYYWDASSAFCLHPLVQDLKHFLRNVYQLAAEVDAVSLAQAVEYRSQANSYSTHNYKVASPPNAQDMSPVTRDMLKADKIQNYWNLTRNRKDLKHYSELLCYFQVWFDALELTVDHIEYWLSVFDEMKANNGFAINFKKPLTN